MRRLAFIVSLAALPAYAAEFVPMSGADITSTLTGAKLTYDGGAWQDFRASGRTLYNTGRDSWGYWEVRGDQYCSQWPPSDLWACYGMARQGQVIRFIDANGETIDGILGD